MLGRKVVFCASEPAVSSASIAPSVSSGHSAKLRFALLTISPHAAWISLGKPWPPKSVGCCRPCQPPSPNCLNASLKPGVAVTLPSLKVEGLRSPSMFSGAMTPSLSFAHSSSTACAVSGPASSNAGSLASSSMPASSFITKSMSLTGAR